MTGQSESEPITMPTTGRVLSVAVPLTPLMLSSCLSVVRAVLWSGSGVPAQDGDDLASLLDDLGDLLIRADCHIDVPELAPGSPLLAVEVDPGLGLGGHGPRQRVGGGLSLVLIDGERLARLMIKYHVGVQVARTYTVMKLDEDFFEES